jgi:hypothetical protein
LRELGHKIHAVGGKQPHGKSRSKSNALHLEFESLVIHFEGRDTLAIGWKPVFVATFRIAAERGDVESGISVEELVQLLRHAWGFFDTLLVGNASEIKIFGSLREIRRAAELKKGKYGAPRRVAMQGIFRLQGRCGGRGWRGSGNGLGTGGGPEEQQSAREQHRWGCGPLRKKVSAPPGFYTSFSRWA